jgi:hypothetical protein
MGKAITIQLNQEDANRILLALELAEDKLLEKRKEPSTHDMAECISIARLADKIFDVGIEEGFGQKSVVKMYGNTKVTMKPKLFADDETHSGDGHAVG